MGCELGHMYIYARFWWEKVCRREQVKPMPFTREKFVYSGVSVASEMRTP